MDECESCLEKVKKDYEQYRMKYNLPEFDKLNQDFAIEKISEIETDLLLREVRKFIADRLSNYMRFIEGLLNPANASIFTFSICKTFNLEDKKEIEDMFKELMRLEIELMEIDIQYSEEKEANFIKNSFEKWSSFKTRWKKIVDVVKKNWDNRLESGNKGYFG